MSELRRKCSFIESNPSELQISKYTKNLGRFASQKKKILKMREKARNSYKESLSKKYSAGAVSVAKSKRIAEKYLKKINDDGCLGKEVFRVGRYTAFTLGAMLKYNKGADRVRIYKPADIRRFGFSNAKYVEYKRASNGEYYDKNGNRAVVVGYEFVAVVGKKQLSSSLVTKPPVKPAAKEKVAAGKEKAPDIVYGRLRKMVGRKKVTSVNFRSNPSMRKSVVIKPPISINDKFQIIKGKKRNGIYSGWVKIKMLTGKNEGKEGYVYSRYIEEIKLNSIFDKKYVEKWKRRLDSYNPKYAPVEIDTALTKDLGRDNNDLNRRVKELNLSKKPLDVEKRSYYQAIRYLQKGKMGPATHLLKYLAKEAKDPEIKKKAREIFRDLSLKWLARADVMADIMRKNSDDLLTGIFGFKKLEGYLEKRYVQAVKEILETNKAYSVETAREYILSGKYKKGPWFLKLYINRDKAVLDKFVLREKCKKGSNNWKYFTLKLADRLGRDGTWNNVISFEQSHELYLQILLSNASFVAKLKKYFDMYLPEVRREVAKKRVAYEKRLKGQLIDGKTLNARQLLQINKKVKSGGRLFEISRIVLKIKGLAVAKMIKDLKERRIKISDFKFDKYDKKAISSIKNLYLAKGIERAQSKVFDFLVKKFPITRVIWEGAKLINKARSFDFGKVKKLFKKFTPGG